MSRPQSPIDTITSQAWPKNGNKANPARAKASKATGKPQPGMVNHNAARGTLTIWRRRGSKWHRRGRPHEGVTLREARELVMPHVGEWFAERSPHPVIIGTDPALLEAFRADGVGSGPRGTSAGHEKAKRRAHVPGGRGRDTTGVWV